MTPHRSGVRRILDRAADERAAASAAQDAARARAELADAPSGTILDGGTL